MIRAERIAGDPTLKFTPNTNFNKIILQQVKLIINRF